MSVNIPQPSPQERIYQALARVPEGRLVSYGQLAELAGLSGRARMVGKTLSQLPADSRLPWHRVVCASGKISFPADSTGFQRQVTRLIDEGSALPSGQLRWRECRWQPGAE